MTQNTTTTKGLRQLDPEALSGSVESLFPGQLAGSLQRLTQDDLMKLIELADAVYPDPTKVYKSNTVRSTPRCTGW